MISDTTRTAIAAMGTQLGPDILARCTALFDEPQRAFAATMPLPASDVAYGADPRHRLDLYAPQGSGGGGAPILLLVHGGGFRTGDKGGGERWSNAAVGRLAAQAGFLGVVINYRLAPAHQWPAGGEDVGLAVDWLKANAGAHGGDPTRIVLVGTSAGSVHIAAYLQFSPDESAVAAAVLLSGLYGFTPLDEKDVPYYGPPNLYAERMPLEAVAATRLPLLVACAEFDPPRFQAEFLGLLAERLRRHGAMPRAYVASGHNHYSMAMHLGTGDRRLADEIISFTREHCA